MYTDEPGYIYEDKPGKKLFSLGQLLMSRGIAASGMAMHDIATFIVNHQHGLWGDDITDEDSVANNCGVRDGGRVLSAYRWTDADGEERRVYVITEGEDDNGVRAATTIMFSEEY